MTEKSNTINSREAQYAAANNIYFTPHLRGRLYKPSNDTSVTWDETI
jgi:hypothetical protein